MPVSPRSSVAAKRAPRLQLFQGLNDRRASLFQRPARNHTHLISRSLCLCSLAPRRLAASLASCSEQCSENCSLAAAHSLASPLKKLLRSCAGGILPRAAAPSCSRHTRRLTVPRIQCSSAMRMSWLGAGWPSGSRCDGTLAGWRHASSTQPNKDPIASGQESARLPAPGPHLSQSYWNTGRRSPGRCFEQSQVF